VFPPRSPRWHSRSDRHQPERLISNTRHDVGASRVVATIQRHLINLLSDEIVDPPEYIYRTGVAWTRIYVRVETRINTLSKRILSART